MLWSMKHFLLFGLMLGMTLFGGPARALTVVELFTSQGCSSCPPADALLGELAQRDGILALSRHVGYWDYIGWKDPFALPANTERQRVYARRLGLPYVYTPQIVVQGATQAVGSQRGPVDRAIAAARRGAAIPVTVRRTDAGVVVALEPARLDGSVVVSVVEFDPERVTTVRRGENGGRTLHDIHVVRGETSIGRWTGEAAEFPVPPPSEPGRRQAVIVQVAGTGRILGAATID